MANKICLKQALTLNFTDNDNTDMSLVNFRVDYWKPSNLTDTPDGTVNPAQITTTPASPIVKIDILKDLLDEPSTGSSMWRFQIIDNDSGVCWTTMSFQVKNKGQC